MNKYWIVLLLVAGAAAAVIALSAKEPTDRPPEIAAQETVPAALASAPGPGEALRVLDVEGMCCGGCRPKVFAALRAVPGVREAAVEIGSATVIVPADADVAALERALTFDKYVAHARP